MPRRRSRRKLARMENKLPDTGVNKVREQAKKTSKQLRPYASTAREAAAQRVMDAREWAAPRLETAAESVQRDVAPKVATALSTAAERSAPARAEAERRGAAALSAIKGEAPKKRRRWPLALLFLVLGAAAGAAGGIVSQRGMPPLRVSGTGSPSAPTASAPPPSKRTSDTDTTAADGQGTA